MAANINSARTPNLQRNNTTEALSPNTADIKKLLEMMKDTWSSIGQTYDILYEQSTKLSDLSPTMHQQVQEIQKVHDQIQSRVNDNDNAIKQEKQAVQGEMKGRIMRVMKVGLKEAIKSQITLQVSSQIAVQVKEHLPVTLEDQLRESKVQYEEVKVSLMNSEARHQNSVLRVRRDGDALLNTVLTPNGEVSGFFPATFKTLFAYDLNNSQSLVRDYKLHVSDVREVNFNSFMSHIGVKDSLPVLGRS